MNVIFLPEIQEYYAYLEQVLYDEGYFGTIQSSHKYVKELFDDITDNLHKKLHRPAPLYFDQYGENMKYAVFKKNRHTSWYVFFKTYVNNGETIYLVRYIANNHVIAQYL